MLSYNLDIIYGPAAYKFFCIRFFYDLAKLLFKNREVAHKYLSY